MIVVNFEYNGQITKGILLGKYRRPHEEVYTVEKKFFGKKKVIDKWRKSNSFLYIIFIPWKHQLKELVEIDEKYILNIDSIVLNDEWVSIDKYISESDDEYYAPSVVVKEFVGYRFMYENNSFIIDLVLHNSHKNLSILYKHIPKILDIDLNNIEE
jgi:hypothetical protein